MALAHEQPDRCPMQISFTPEFADRLRKEIGKTDNVEHNPHGGGNTYDLERAFGEDMLLTSVGWANSYYHNFQPGQGYTDEWGVGWQVFPYQTKYGNGIYTEIVRHPLAEDDALDCYEAPDPNRPELYQDAWELIGNFKEEYCIVGVTVTTMFETAWALRGLERMLMDFVEKPDLAARILDIPYHYHLTAAQKLVEMGVDIIWIGDDVGAQKSMLISPQLWRAVLKPRIKNYIGRLKEINPALKIAYHSDGVINPIIPDLVEVGVDILNPIQPACMDPARIKEEFGDRLCFWGTIDEQHTLPFGTPRDVENEVKARLQTVGKGGGLIIGPTHHVQLDTPMENFRAMVDTIMQGIDTGEIL